MNGTLQEIALGEPRPASVADIEAGLSEMWRSVAGGTEADSAVTRASALTLLVYVDDERGAQDVSNLIAEVTRQNPCRAIVMLIQPEAAPAGLTATISAHCHVPLAGEKQICSEQITLRAKGEMGPELASVVLPLTVSGLPIYFWWRAGAFTAPPWLDQILRVTDHVIVDSARFSMIGSDLAGLAAWVSKTAGRVRVSDLNWARATPWRELLAQCFDSPDRRPYLERITSVRIEYEMGSTRLTAQRAQGLLLGAWMATRLGWKYQRTERRAADQPRTHYFQCQGREICFERVLRRVEGRAHGVCFSLVLEGGGARFSFKRGMDGTVVHTLAEVPGARSLGRTVRVPVVQETETLNEELMLAHPDHVYEETLAMVARMTAA